MKALYGESVRPDRQWPIVAPKGKRTQDKWIIGVFADEEFQLFVCVDGRPVIASETPVLPYSRLWETLAKMCLGKGKWWMIGHRTRLALEQSDFMQALEDGAIRLPRSKKKGCQHKRSGRLVYSLRCLEIDIVAGKNDLKILDWKNYGFEVPPGAKTVTEEARQAALQLWLDYVALCDKTGMLLNKTTAAQMGWQHARMHYGPPVLLYNLDDDIRAMERRAYIGGRNECYRLGEIPDATLSLDVKSSYAAICRSCTLPVYMEDYYPLGLAVENLVDDGSSHWIADVVIATPAPDYPLRHQGIPIYPTGVFATSLAWPELQHALQRGRVEKILRAGRYKASRAMSEYAKWYLAARQAVNDAGLDHVNAALKSAFNGSLGYTARQKYELQPWQMDLDKNWWIGYTVPPDHSGPIAHAQILDGVKEWLKIGGEPREAMPFLHATICSWARIFLLHIMEAAGREWIHYCDTDGILVDYRGYANLLDTPGMIGQEPGQLGERFKSGPCRIQGQKNYRIGDQVICSGMVRTRNSVWQEKHVLETPTGRVDSEGRVTPFEMRCEDIGDEVPKYVNVFA